MAQRVISLGVGPSIYLTNGISLGNLFKNYSFAIQTEVSSLFRVIDQSPGRTKV